MPWIGATDFLCLQSVQNNWGNHNKGNRRPDCDSIWSHKSLHTKPHTTLWKTGTSSESFASIIGQKRWEAPTSLTNLYCRSSSTALWSHEEAAAAAWSGNTAVIKATLMRSPSPIQRFKWDWVVMHATCSWTFNRNFNQNDTKCPLQLLHFPPHDTTKCLEIPPDSSETSAPICVLIPPAAVKMLLSEPRMWTV